MDLGCPFQDCQDHLPSFSSFLPPLPPPHLAVLDHLVAA